MIEDEVEAPEDTNFRKHIFCVVLDNLIGGLTVRFTAAKLISDTFNFFGTTKRNQKRNLSRKQLN